MFKLNRAKFN